MLRIFIILFFRTFNALRRGKFCDNVQSCSCYALLALGLIHYNVTIRSAINVARGIVTREFDLEELSVDTDIPIVDYEEAVGEVKTQKLPSAYIIGAQRCATTALADFLQIHPDVQIVPSEVRYFDKYFSNGIDWYKSNMPLCSKHQITIERSPTYFTTAAVAERLFKARPKAKIILGLREPAKRAVSEYASLEKTEGPGKFYRPFREFAFEMGNLGKMNKNWTVLANGKYADHLHAWLKFFPRHRIYIYTAEELAAEPGRILRELQIFLQLRYYVNEAHFKINGTNKGFPCIVDPADEDHECLNDTMKAVNLKHPNIEWSVLNNVKAYYINHNKDVYNLTGRNFNW